MGGFGTVGFIGTISMTLVTFPLAFHYARNYARARENLASQLENFSMQSVHCAREEDRAIVNTTVELWFGSLEKFDRKVRTKVAEYVLSHIPHATHFPLSIVSLWFLAPLGNVLDWSAAYFRFERNTYIAPCFIINLLVLFPIMDVLSRALLWLASIPCLRRSRTSMFLDALVSIGGGEALSLFFIGANLAGTGIFRFQGLVVISAWLSLWIAVALLLRGVHIRCYNALKYGHGPYKRH